ncbi:hypothetical protein C0995_002415 [Termitomyces sp. Mi166|nr:hypothetical protein C0995_002415 [Termitomyces sp. Mi166\
MDPRLSYEITTQLPDISTPPAQKVNLGTRLRGRHYDAGKRYATYFPSNASLGTEWAEIVADDESTWEFFAPVSPMARNFRTDSCSAVSAQEITSRYCPGMPLKAVLSMSSASVSSEKSDSTSWEAAPGDGSITSEMEVSPPIPEKDHLVAAQCKSFCNKELSDSVSGLPQEYSDIA